MRTLELTILNPTGLHARPAKTLVKLAKKFDAKISIEHGSKSVNAKSMISVLTLGVKKDGVVQFKIDGADEDAAAKAIEEAVLSGLGEGEHIAKANEAAAKGAAPAQTNAHKAPPPAPVVPVSTDESVLNGVPVATGIAIGPVWRIVEESNAGSSSVFTTVENEKSLLEKAISTAEADLVCLHDDVNASAAGAEAEIFAAHLEIVQDDDLVDDVNNLIVSDSLPADAAWSRVVEQRATLLSQLDDPLLAARSSDVRDVGRRVLQVLHGKSSGLDLPDHPVILLAEDLLPSDTVSLSADSVLAFATTLGGPNTHSAILARAMGITAVVSLPKRLLDLENGTTVILNGDTGKLIIEPDADQVREAKSAQRQKKLAQERMQKLAHNAAITKDGHQVEIVGNAGSVADAIAANEAGAEGIGLFRTEFLFLQSETEPTEEEQFTIYRDVVQAMNNQPVIFRTLDVGGDKPLPYINVPHEDNPFLGERGIRLCLNRPELFRTQLRALIRAAADGPVRIMFPMVSMLSEWHQIKEHVDAVRNELPAVDIELGIMIELPAAAILADLFAQEVDFFSIGTNDLTQYTLAIDRMHATLANKADGLDPAVLRLIKQTVDAAHAHGKWVGVCGELGADAKAIPILVGLGVDELSVTVPAVAQTKSAVRKLSLSEAKQLAAKALFCHSPQEVRALTD